MKTQTQAEPTAVQDFDLADFDRLDQSEMTVTLNGKLTDWKWTFAGPGHPQTIAFNERSTRDRLFEERQKEQAQVNGRKWKAPEKSLDEIKEGNIDWILARLLGWSGVRFNGEDFPFTVDNARKLLLDPRKDFIVQAIEFLTEEKSFTRRSAIS